MDINKVNEFVNNKKGELLSNKYNNNKTKLIVRCENGHIWETQWYRLQRGAWCGQCVRDNNKLSTKDIKKVVKDSRYVLLTDGELNRHSRFNVKCKKHNFIWETCYGNLKYIKGCCKLCASNAVSHNKLVKFLETKNGTFVRRDEEIRRDRRNLIIKCNVHNVEFRTRWFDLFKRGVWCALCEDESRIIKHKDIKELVEKYDGKLLSLSCSSATEIFRVKCNKDSYEWNTSWARIKSGCWCPKCVNHAPYTLEDIKNIVSKKGGKLLTDKIDNVKHRIDILCNCGYKFSITSNHMISHKQWCPVCGPRSKEQKEIYNILKNIFPSCQIYYNYRGFNWLKSDKKYKQRMEIDIWVPDIKLAIEYDGIQHFKPTKFSSNMTDEQAKKTFAEVKRRDKKKIELIEQHQDIVRHFIRFNYKDKIDFGLVKERLKENGIQIQC
jgi:hypothetical protein